MSEEEPASTEATGAESPPFDLRTVAYEELGETPQLKRDTVMELRKLINAEPDLKCPSDDAFLVKFLRARKYRVEEAFCTIRKYFRVRQVHRNIFDDLRPSQIMFNAVFHQNKLVTILDERDHLGRLVAILKLGAWKPHMCPLDELFRAGVLVGEYILLSETTQVAGVVAVVDLEGLNFELFRHYTPSVVRKLIELAQECYPIRIKGVYITNNPPIFELIYSAAKLFLKPKLVDRVRREARLWARDWHPNVCSLDKLAGLSILAWEHLLEDPRTQVKGIVMLIDLGGGSFSHLRAASPTQFSMFVYNLQECCPLRLKSAHVVNQPMFFTSVFALVKPFLKEKLVRRMRVHGKDLDSLHQFLPPDILPEEFGGLRGPFDNAAFCAQLYRADALFKEHNTFGYRPDTPDEYVRRKDGCGDATLDYMCALWQKITSLSSAFSYSSKMPEADEINFEQGRFRKLEID
ncbi:hypothetical protein ISCGN_026014 [Ixodes scapularis]